MKGIEWFRLKKDQKWHLSLGSGFWAACGLPDDKKGERREAPPLKERCKSCVRSIYD